MEKFSGEFYTRLRDILDRQDLVKKSISKKINILEDEKVSICDKLEHEQHVFKHLYDRDSKELISFLSEAGIGEI